MAGECVTFGALRQHYQVTVPASDIFSHFQHPYAAKNLPSSASPTPCCLSRVCGGAAIAAWHSEGWAGLSPRVRGSLHPIRLAYPNGRSIPAGAGEPTPVRRRAALSAVYPRGCGGANSYQYVGNDALGLSPRVRGSPIVRTAYQVSNRSIPACAGEPNDLHNG